MSAARHVHDLDARERNPLAIVNTVLAVAAATIWFVALPVARDEGSPQRSRAVIPVINEDLAGGAGASLLTPAPVVHK